MALEVIIILLELNTRLLELNIRLWNGTEDFGTEQKTLELNRRLWNRTEDFGTRLNFANSTGHGQLD